MPTVVASDLLVCYDVTEPTRLRRIHRHMLRWGMPLQYSVFYCRLAPSKRRRLEAELRDLIDGRRDDVRIYAVSAERHIRTLGQSLFGEGIVVHGLPAVGGF